jgi:para-nitrobenzyl esterase
VNVWAPDAAGSEPLPVMLWIHDGGNSVGHGGFFDGSGLATAGNVVVVTVNYRLGPFGWFRRAALRDEATTDAERSGNFATLDLLRALAWVRDNAAAFGSDPGNVTIFGESAGGTNVVTLLVSPLARGLFHRAIVESGGLRTTSVDEAEHARDDRTPGHRHSSTELLLALLEGDGMARDRAGAEARLAGMTPADVRLYLRSKTTAEVLAVAAPGNFGGMLDVPAVFRDGTVLPLDPPFDVLGQPGRYSAVPIVLGTNRDEMKLFLFTNPAFVRRWLGIFPVVHDRTRYDVAAEYGSRMWAARAATEPAMRLAHAPGQRVWAYRFDWDEEPRLLGADLPGLLGAAHRFEIPFVFGHFDLGRDANRLWTRTNEPGRLALSAAMASYWAAFAASGDPSQGRHGELPRWQPWDDGILVLDTPAGGGMRMSSDVVTGAAVVRQLEPDPRLPGRRAQCRTLAGLARFGAAYSRAEYARDCPDVPFD